MQLILVLGILFFAFISPGSPLQCRECSSKVDQNCLNNFDKVNLVDCTTQSSGLVTGLNQTANATVTYLCAKCYLKTSGALIGRACIPNGFQDKISKILKCDFCETDDCNSSSIIGTGIISIVLPLLVRYLGYSIEINY